MRFTEAELTEIRAAFRRRVRATAAEAQPPTSRTHRPKPPPLLPSVSIPDFADAQVLPARAVADVFRVSTRVVGLWARAGRVPCFRTLGGHWRFRWGDLRRTLEESETARPRLVDDESIEGMERGHP
jgi:hypothetical protein